MKNKLLIIPVLFAVVFGVTSCSPTTKNDIQEYIGAFQIGAYLREATTFNGATGAFQAAGNLGNTFDYGNLAAGKIGKKVRPWGAPISKINVYVVKGQNNNQTAWKLVKSYTRTPTDTSYFDITVTTAEMATALGLPLDQTTFSLGSVFTCYTEVITSDNKKYTINNTNADVTAAGSFYFAIFNFSGTVVCPYVPAAMVGNYKVVEDGWEDWVAGDILNNVVINTTATSLQMQNVYPSPAFGGQAAQPIVVTVDAVTGTARVTNSRYGNYGGTDWYVSTAGSGNFVLSCVGTITLLLNHHRKDRPDVTAGNYRLTLQKQ
jgi:hypothetical protein